MCACSRSNQRARYAAVALLAVACKSRPPTVDLPEAAPESAEQKLERVSQHRHPELVCPTETTLRVVEDASHYTFFCENAAGKKHGFYAVFGRDGEFQIVDRYKDGVPVR